LILFPSSHQHRLVGFAALCSGLIILGWLFSPPGGAVGPVTYNRTMGIALLWVTALFLRHRKQVEETLRHAQEVLESKVAERTADLQKAINSLEKDIAERKRAEEALKESVARYRAILESAMDAVITTTQEGRIVEFNPAAEAMFGCTRDAVIGKEMAEQVIPPSLRERHHIGMARYLASGTTSIIGRRIEIIAMRTGGMEFPVELTVTQVGQEGKPLFMAFIRDITERKLAELALHESEERFRLMISHASDAIFYLDLD